MTEIVEKIAQLTEKIKHLASEHQRLKQELENKNNHIAHVEEKLSISQTELAEMQTWRNEKENEWQQLQNTNTSNETHKNQLKSLIDECLLEVEMLLETNK